MIVSRVPSEEKLILQNSPGDSLLMSALTSGSHVEAMLSVCDGWSSLLLLHRNVVLLVQTPPETCLSLTVRGFTVLKHSDPTATILDQKRDKSIG